MTKHLCFWGVALVVGGSLLALTHLAVAGPGPGQGGETRIKIRLTVDPAILASNPAAQASAEFRSRAGRPTRLNVEVSGMPGLNGQTLNVAYSAGALSPSSMVVALGRAQLEANGVAAPSAGTTVTITKASDGSAVAGPPATF